MGERDDLRDHLCTRRFTLRGFVHRQHCAGLVGSVRHHRLTSRVITERVEQRGRVGFRDEALRMHRLSQRIDRLAAAVLHDAAEPRLTKIGELASETAGGHGASIDATQCADSLSDVLGLRAGARCTGWHDRRNRFSSDATRFSKRCVDLATIAEGASPEKLVFRRLHLIKRQIEAGFVKWVDGVERLIHFLRCLRFCGPDSSAQAVAEVLSRLLHGSADWRHTIERGEAGRILRGFASEDGAIATISKRALQLADAGVLQDLRDSRAFADDVRTLLTESGTHRGDLFRSLVTTCGHHGLCSADLFGREHLPDARRGQ